MKNLFINPLKINRLIFQQQGAETPETTTKKSPEGFDLKNPYATADEKADTAKNTIDKAVLASGINSLLNKEISAQGILDRLGIDDEIEKKASKKK